MEFEYLRKVAFKLNKVLISSLGVSVVPVYYLVVNKNWADKLLYFQRIFNLLKDVEGDIVECGVASGRSLTILATLVKNSGINRHIWGFDSWEGLPKPSNEDLASLESIAKRGRFKNSSPERVHTTLWAYGFSNSEIQDIVTLVKGWFSETIPKYRGSRIALLHLDVDLYDSYKDCLHYLWPMVSVDGIVAFDEYHLPNKWPGAKRAVDEFFSQSVPGSARLQRDAVSGLYYAVKTA